VFDAVAPDVARPSDASPACKATIDLREKLLREEQEIVGLAFDHVGERLAIASAPRRGSPRSRASKEAGEASV
jgi:hypothetical protein